MTKIDLETKSDTNPLHEYTVERNGFKCTYDENDLFHSYDENPAAVWPDGRKYWYKHGKLHRDNNLPAVINPDGSKSWWENGVLYKIENNNTITFNSRKL